MLVSDLAVAIEAAMSPSRIRRIRAPAARTAWIYDWFLGRSSKMTVRSLTSLPLALATCSRLWSTGAFEVYESCRLWPLQSCPCRRALLGNTSPPRPFSDRNHRQGAGLAVRSEGRPIDRVNGYLDLSFRFPLPTFSPL